MAAGETFEETNTMLTGMMEDPGGANDWSEAHHAAFEVDKFALVHFTRKTESVPGTRRRRLLKGPSLTLGDIVIEPQDSAKLLGVHLDRTLKWKVQANAAHAKGMKYMMAAKRLSQGKRGVPGRLGVQLYTGVVVPKMLYAAEIWCSLIVEPEGRRKKKKGSVGFAKLLAPVQRLAGIFVTGAMKSTPTVTLDAHADFLPMAQLINRICHRAALRWGTKPEEHPLHGIVNFAFWTTVPGSPDTYPPPMRTLFEALGVKASNLEKIDIVRRSPYWSHAMEIYIAASKHESLADEMADTAPIRIYSDGSGLDGCIGAATVMFKRGAEAWDEEEQTSLRKYLGSEEEQTVYVGEQAGELMSLELL
ncbi:hypothetical protein FIBSPDRAFT_685577, partial [Athelia psychrophila]